MSFGPGTDVRCPTCQQLTPPGAFCQRCGSALPFDLGYRPPADSRSEVGERLRLRQEERAKAGHAGAAEEFNPEPSDALRQTDEDEATPAWAAAAAGGAAAFENLPPDSEPTPSSGPPMPVDPVPPVEPPPAAAPEPEPSWPAEPAIEPEWEVVPPRGQPAPMPYSEAASLAAMERDPGSPPPPPRRPRRTAGDGADGGVSPLIFAVFLVIGIVALVGGAALGGFFNNGGVAEATPTPTPSLEVTPSPTVPASPAVSGEPSPSILPSDAPPTSFPDGFIARSEACAEQPTGPSCDNSGATNNGTVWTLVSFRHAHPDDVIGVAIVDSQGNLQADATLDLSFCGTNTDCAGYTYFRFDNLPEDDYRVRVTRNGTPAAETTFSVVP